MKEREIRSLLYKLGRSGRQIAHNLENLGCKGVVRNPEACPVFNYLKKNNVDVELVDYDGIIIDNGYSFEPSDFIINFLKQFDNHKYKNLEE